MYTDGSSRGNPGPGGYGTILSFGDHYKELSEGYRMTTNNRMELMAVIVGLEAIKNNQYPVVIYSDSKYVVESVEKGWIWGWEKKGFKGKKNPDLWQRYIRLHKRLKVKFIWVKGHAGHPQNERCDELAVESALGPNLKVDQGYEDSV
jgi:ribonuclease HI